MATSMSLAKNFSLKYAIYYYFSEIPLQKIGLYKILRLCFKKKSQYIYSYIDENFREIIQEHKNKVIKKEFAERFNIWVFWAQGIDNAPDLVKICHKQLNKLNRGNVITLDMNNYFDYVTIPNHIITKVKDKKISLTHFSDILRVSLLAKYGGLWIDSTCFVTCNFETTIAPNSIWTLSSKVLPKKKGVAMARWTSYFIGTDSVNNTLFTLIRDIFYKYFETNNQIIDYLFLDYIINYIYENFTEVQSMIGSGAINGDRRLTMKGIIAKEYNEDIFNELISDTKVFKLSYRWRLIEKNSLGKQTTYGKLKELYI